MTSKLLRHALVLGWLTAIGPFAIDMYLPALPSVGASLGVGPDSALMSLTVFFVALAFGQLAYGPASDMVGRKAPLYFGLGLFILGSIGCALATDINTLIGARVLQGFGGAAGGIIARAIVRDMYSGLEEVRLMSLLMLVFSVSPLLAPLVGTLIIELADWRAVFWFSGIAAALALVVTAVAVKETRAPDLRAASTIPVVLASMGRVLSDRKFVGCALTGAFGVGGFFVFLSNSSFVMIDQFGLTPLLFSLCFSLNAAAFFAAAQFNGKLGARFGLRQIVRPAAFGYAAVTALLLALWLAGVHELVVMMAFLFVSYGFLGVFLPITSVLALADHGAVAGAASSLMGTTHLLVGASVMAVSGQFADGTALPMIAGIAVCATLAFACAQLTLGGRPAPVSAPAE